MLDLFCREESEPHARFILSEKLLTEDYILDLRVKYSVMF